MKIILIGYMGSGKTTIGELLSNALNYTFIDLDQEIERMEGASTSKLFETKGEIYFRKKERTVFLSLLEGDENSVIATGGGTPCYGDILEVVNAMSDVTTVYIKLDLDALTERLFKEKEGRPMIAHLKTKELLNDFIRKHLFERAFYYNQAKKIIDVSGLEMKATVEKLVLSLL